MRPMVFCVFFLSVFLSCEAAQEQCRQEFNIQGMALNGFIFKKFSARGPHVCDDICDRELTCQSFNYVTETNTCELNNRTKEARPENFKPDPARFYIRRLNNRVPLGSIRELPAKSCQEIKASEGKGTISNNYWLDLADTGLPYLSFCNMNSVGSRNIYTCSEKSCYTFTESGKTWTENRNTCKGEGGDLVSMETEEEWQFINDEIQHRSIAYLNEYHIGLEKNGGDWTWINGGPLTISKWQVTHGEPSGDGDVAVMSKDYPPGTQGLFNDLPDYFKRAFICEMPQAT